MALNKNTVVMAGAGTGKTRKLVHTYVDLLERGIDPLRIVAVTFTEKAAGEMRDRVRQAIADRMERTPPGEQEMWMRLLGVLPAAPISTIHGFCGMLLREHGLEIGVDPSFSILDEQRGLDIARESAVETIRREIREGNASVARLFGDYGLEGLTDIVVNATYWMNSLGRDAEWLRQRAADQAAAAQDVLPAVAEYLEKYGGFEGVGLFADEQDARRGRHPLRKRDRPDAPLPQIGQIAGVEVTAALADLIALYAGVFRARKTALNAIDFDDLLLLTRRLLTDAEHVRRYCQDHFQAILVDEFQDTDEVQAGIIRLLARDPENPSRYAPGKLMIVGDRKQSIYRFRRARVTVFVHLAEEILQDGGERENLNENRRSAPPLVDFSNRLSAHMMDGQGRNNLPAGLDLSYRIRFSEDDLLTPRADHEFQGITYIAADPEARAAAGRVMEAEAIARLLKKWKSGGVIQSWREAALLMRSATNFNLYADALEMHNIPVYVVQGMSFYQKSEVSDLIALLEWILHPNDNAARVTVLTSALAGLSYRDVLEGKTSTELERIVAPWVELRDRATAAEILEDVIRKTNFDVVTMAQKGGEQRVANIGKLIEITRNLARQGTTALDDVVRYLRDRARDTKGREAEAQMLGEDQDAVRILTVHGAKGLEFDAVIIPDLAARTPAGSSDKTFFSDRWGLLAGAVYGLHRKTLPHALILQAKEEEEDQQFEEEKRLLYVAVTRAQKMLVLGEGSCQRPGLWLQWIQSFFESVQPGAIEKAREGKACRIRFRSRGADYPVEMVSAKVLSQPEQLSLAIDVAAGNNETAFMEMRMLAGQIRRKLPAAQTLNMTPSDLGILRGCYRYFHSTRILGLPDPARKPSGDTPQMKLGTEVHRILESGIRPGEDTLAELQLQDLQAVFESDAWQELTRENVERELPFMLQVRLGEHDCFIHGRMDAVVDGNPPRVIDYKYAQWKAGAESAYEAQMAAYALALMKSAGSESAIAELWYLKAPMKIFRQEYTRQQAETRLAELLSGYLGALASGEWPKAARAHCDATFCGFIPQCWDSSGAASLA